MQRLIKICVFAALLALASTPVLAGTVVIVSAKSPTAKLDKSQVSALYLGKTSNLPQGGKAKLFDLPGSSASRDAFYQAVTGKSASQVKSVWSRLVFSGRAVPPKELGSDAAVVQAVAADPNAIGYVDSSAVNGSVKVVFKLP